MHCTGLLACTTVPGAFTSELFENYLIENILPQMSPFPQPKSVVLFDGCSIHKNIELFELIHRMGCIALIIPPYSPEMNPIENVFSKLKSFFKRHRNDLSHLQDLEFIDMGFYNITEQDCTNFILHAGY